MPQKAVIFDRDGTLIVDKLYLNDHKKIEYLPQVFTSLKRLRDAGYVFAVATNQSGVPRGVVTPQNLEDIHAKIRSDFSAHGVDILGFYYAPFMPETDHFLRKPNAGMLLEAASQFNFNLNESWMIGDRMTDVEAGHRAGCRSILLKGITDEMPELSEYAAPEAHVDGLVEATNFILKNDYKP